MQTLDTHKDFDFLLVSNMSNGGLLVNEHPQKVDRIINSGMIVDEIHPG